MTKSLFRLLPPTLLKYNKPSFHPSFLRRAKNDPLWWKVCRELYFGILQYCIARLTEELFTIMLPRYYASSLKKCGKSMSPAVQSLRYTRMCWQTWQVAWYPPTTRPSFNYALLQNAFLELSSRENHASWSCAGEGPSKHEAEILYLSCEERDNEAVGWSYRIIGHRTWSRFYTVFPLVKLENGSKEAVYLVKSN